MNIFNCLNYRSEFELIIKDNSFDLPDYNSDINSLRWFIRNGRRRNGLRNNFEKALTIAKTIVREYNDNSKQNGYRQGRSRVRLGSD